MHLPLLEALVASSQRRALTRPDRRVARWPASTPMAVLLRQVRTDLDRAERDQAIKSRPSLQAPCFAL
jgi:hypothetical protein